MREIYESVKHHKIFEPVHQHNSVTEYGHFTLYIVGNPGMRKGECSLTHPTHTLVPIPHLESESTTTGSGSSFSVGDGDQCGVLHGDYRFPT